MADSVPDRADLSGACDEYATLVGECFGTPKLAESTRKALSATGRSAEQLEAQEKQCKTSAQSLRRSCK